MSPGMALDASGLCRWGIRHALRPGWYVDWLVFHSLQPPTDGMGLNNSFFPPYSSHRSQITTDQVLARGRAGRRESCVCGSPDRRRDKLVHSGVNQTRYLQYYPFHFWSCCFVIMDVIFKVYLGSLWNHLAMIYILSKSGWLNNGCYMQTLH